MAVYYTKDHDWIEIDGHVATVGITDYAQKQLGDVLFVEIPPPGAELAKGREAALVESVKAASDILSPLTGIVTECNRALESEPSLVNASPEGKGWFFRMAMTKPAELEGLLDADTYYARVKRLT
jgi:glycine cleavage system H protein